MRYIHSLNINAVCFACLKAFTFVSQAVLVCSVVILCKQLWLEEFSSFDLSFLGLTFYFPHSCYLFISLSLALSLIRSLYTQ